MQANRDWCASGMTLSAKSFDPTRQSQYSSVCEDTAPRTLLRKIFSLLPFLFSLLPFCVALAAPLVHAAPPPGYTLAWSDEFNGATLNKAYWVTVIGLPVV